MGRPTEYREAYAEGARKLARLGATDEEVADFFGVNVSTIYRWKNAHQAFCEALKVGKDEADDRVQRALYHKAVGYEQDAVKIFMPAGAEAPVYAPYKERFAPDTTAAIFWLKNRRPNEWRDVNRQELTGKDGGPVQIEDTAAADILKARLDAIANRTAGGATGE